LSLFFTSLAGSTQIRVYPGTATSGTQLGSVNVNYTSPAATLSLSGVATGGGTGTITVVVTANGAYSANTSLFSLDSVAYSYTTYTLSTSLYTQCGDPKDKYEFGFNGKLKDNEIAGVGNSYDYGFRRYDPRLGRFWSVDPLRTRFPFYS